VTLTPGLDTALVLRATIAGGRRVGAATGAGVSTGTICWGLLAAAGATAVLAASRLAFDVLRLAGACYLLWMGVRMLVSTLPDRAAPARPLPAGAPSALAGWRQGLVCNLLNPKVGVFYMAMLPQFLPDGVPALPMGIALAGVHAVESSTWFALLILGAHRARSWLQRPSVRGIVDRLTGLTLIGFGLTLGLSRT
jgi:threonine/homoserine/homoserine lactone efflux protein